MNKVIKRVLKPKLWYLLTFGRFAFWSRWGCSLAVPRTPRAPSRLSWLSSAVFWSFVPVRCFPRLIISFASGFSLVGTLESWLLSCLGLKCAFCQPSIGFSFLVRQGSKLCRAVSGLRLFFVLLGSFTVFDHSVWLLLTICEDASQLLKLYSDDAATLLGFQLIDLDCLSIQILAVRLLGNSYHHRTCSP